MVDTCRAALFCGLRRPCRRSLEWRRGNRPFPCQCDDRGSAARSASAMQRTGRIACPPLFPNFVFRGASGVFMTLLFALLFAAQPYHIDFTRMFPTPEAEKADRAVLERDL